LVVWLRFNGAFNTRAHTMCSGFKISASSFRLFCTAYMKLQKIIKGTDIKQMNNISSRPISNKEIGKIGIKIMSAK